MRKHIVLVALLVGVAIVPVMANDLVVSRVQIRSSVPLPGEVPFEVKPMSHEPGLEIFYLVTGEGLAGIKRDSLVLEYVRTSDGRNWAQNRAGRTTYDMGMFPKVSDDGRYAGFSIRVKQNLFGQESDVTVKGEVTLLIATKRQTVDATIPTAGGRSATAGPFTVQVPSRTGGGGMFGGSQFGVQVAGPRESIIQVEMLGDGAAQRSQGHMTSGDGPTTYFFPKPSGDELTVRINYWSDLEERTVEIGP